ncbi:MAG: hypothetical protein ACE5FJ_12680 [Gemmatimonadales bacterium]
MKQHTIGIVLVLTIVHASPAAAQQSRGVDLTRLRTPASPAFVLLGVEPASIARPSTPAGLAVSLLNGSDNFSVLPRDFALELSPYWLFGHRTLTWRDDRTRTVMESIQRTMSVSVATADLGMEAAPITGLALGFRAAVVSGTLSDSAVAGLNALERGLAETSAEIARSLRQRKEDLDAELAAQLANARTPAEVETLVREHERRVQELLDAEERVAAALAAVDSRHGDLTLERVGFHLEAAAALMWNVPSAAVDSAALDSWGVWITPGYDFGDMAVLTVARLLVGRNADFDRFDLGVRVNYENPDYVVFAEYVRREFLEHESPVGGVLTIPPGSQYRLTGNLEYRLRNNIWLTGTFGKDFDSAGEGSVLAQMGFSLNLTPGISR